PAAAAPLAELAAEEALEDVRHGLGEIAVEARAALPALEGRVAEAVIGRPLLRILQGVVGFVDFLERGLGGLVVRVAVRVVLHGELAEGALQLLFVSRLAGAQTLVEVALRHCLAITSLWRGRTARGRPALTPL